MAQDPHLNNLLKWSIANSGSSSTTSGIKPTSADLSALFNPGPSDAVLMTESITALQSPTLSLPEKLTAFDNLEQLIENLDNANLLAPLGLWAPLLSLASDPEPEIRVMAAWCIGSAVQNNTKCQEAALEAGVVPVLAGLVRDKDQGVRKKACYAVSSEVRNFQRGLDGLVEALGEEKGLDANDMDAVDGLMRRLRGGV